jgi:GNAT superfamily N-acetyltransferase
MPSAMDWQVRDGVAADAEAVRAIALAAWRDTYAGFLRPDTIEGFLERAYSPDRTLRRIERNTFLVAVAADGTIGAYADASASFDRVELFALYADPARRRQGAGTALVDELARRFPALPIVADVLIGNRKGELFYERRGFEPRDEIVEDLLGEMARERTWWRSAARPARASGGVTAPPEATVEGRSTP